MGLLWLSRDTVRQAGGGDPVGLMPLIESALVAHKNGRSCQPLKPYLRIPDDTKARRIIAMPSYLGQPFDTWGIKWIASAPENPTKRGIERASAIIILNDLETARPVAMMEGALISASRTAAVALVAAKYLAPSSPRSLALIGTGMIGSLIANSLLRVYDSIEEVRLFDQRPENALRLAASLADTSECQTVVSDSAEEVLADAELVVTATTASDGYLEGRWFKPGSLFLNVSLRDPNFSVVERADKVVVDDWEQINRGNTIIDRMAKAGLLSRDSIHGELAEIIEGKIPARESDTETIMFNPMGLSIEDLASAWGVYNEAVKQGLGVELEF